MREFKARLRGNSDFRPEIWVNSAWRLFGCSEITIWFASRRTAKAAAERMAKSFGIKLKWEGK